MTEFNSAASQDLGVDLSGSSAESSFQPVPADNYRLQFDEVEHKQTKAGDGSYIKALFSIVGGPLAERKIFCNFNIVNPNADAVRIGQQQLKQFMLAAGGNPNKPLTMADLTALLGKEVLAKVSIRKGKDGYSDDNAIDEFRTVAGEKITDSTQPGQSAPQAQSAQSAAPAQSPPAAPASPPAASGGQGAMPWAN